MKVHMKRLIVALLACWLVLSPALAQTITEEAMAYWQEQMRVLTEEIGCRAIGTDGEQEALWHLMDEYDRFGYRNADGTLRECWVMDASDLIGMKKAKNDNPRVIILCAHYDTMPNTVGARDNASGVAAMLTLMKRLTPIEAFADTEIWFIAMAAEEKRNAGSHEFAQSLSQEDRERILAVFNIDILAVNRGAENVALSCNTQGMRTESGYVIGSDEAPAHNRASLAFEKALWTVGGFSEEERGVTFCVPRTVAMGDHVSFHQIEVDAACVCFQGNLADGGSWPAEMHTQEDTIGDFDLERTKNALEILYTAVCALATDHGCGN